MIASVTAFLQPAFLLLLLPAATVFMLTRRRDGSAGDASGAAARRPPLRRILAAATAMLVILAMARPAVLGLSRAGSIVVVADRSASLSAADIENEASLIGMLSASRSGHERLGVVSFAAKPAVEHTPQEAPFQTFAALHDRDASDLDGALRAALSLVDDDSAARILVLSDGNATGADPSSAAALARARGVPVDFRPLGRPPLNDTAIVRLEAPLEIAPRETLLATAWIQAPRDLDTAYTLHRNGILIARGQLRIPAGLSPVSFGDAAPPSAVNAYEFRVEPAENDSRPENNSARFLVTTAARRPLLLFPASPDSRYAVILRGGGLEVDVLQPSEIDGSIASLAGHAGIVFENVRADAFRRVTLENVVTLVRETGCGLLMTGGKNSFGQGGYYRSPLEDLLPVSLEMRNEQRKYGVAIVVVLDRSGSMCMRTPSGATKMELADRGAAEVLRTLAPMDEIAVLAVDTEPHVVVPMMSVADAMKHERRVATIQSAGGGIYVYEGLLAALKELEKSSAPIRHILLFADAADAENPGAYRELLANAGDAGITVSTIGLGQKTDCDADLLAEIALFAGGTCSITDDAHDLPRLFVQDTFTVARNTFVTNATPLQFTQALPQLSPTLPASMPALGGYNLCYARPDATQFALTADENAAPVAAMRPLGAGRAVAFTGEADGEYGGDFARGTHAAAFHRALARACADDADEAAGFVFAQRLVAGGLEVVAYRDPEAGDAGAVSQLPLRVIRQRRNHTPETSGATLEWSTAEQLSAVLPLAGDETVLVTAMLPSGRSRPLPPVCLPHSGEYAASAFGTGLDTLSRIAEVTGGREVFDMKALWRTLPRTRRTIELAPALYSLAALLLLLQIFERRTNLLSNARPLREKAEAEPARKERKSRRARRRPEHTPEPTPPTPPAATSPEQPDPFAQAKARAKRRM